MMRKVLRENTGQLKPGQDLVVAGPVGRYGTQAILRERREELRNWFTEMYLERIERLGQTDEIPVHEIPVHDIPGAAECEPVGEGGILAALWHISGAYGLGVDFYLRRVPIRQETVEICERYELNPYRLWSGACLLLAADQGEDLAQSFRERGIPAAVAGKVRADQQKRILYGDHAGCLDRPSPDELLKIIPDFDKWTEFY